MQRTSDSEPSLRCFSSQIWVMELPLWVKLLMRVVTCQASRPSSSFFRPLDVARALSASTIKVQNAVSFECALSVSSAVTLGNSLCTWPSQSCCVASEPSSNWPGQDDLDLAADSDGYPHEKDGLDGRLRIALAWLECILLPISTLSTARQFQLIELDVASPNVNTTSSSL